VPKRKNIYGSNEYRKKHAIREGLARSGEIGPCQLKTSHLKKHAVVGNPLYIILEKISSKKKKDFRKFGCLTYVHVLDVQKRKLDTKKHQVCSS